MFGRNGESPVPIIAPQSPGDCFDAAVEAVRIATTYRTPVIMLSDGYLANGSEPWRIPVGRRAPRHDPEFATEPNDDSRKEAEFQPYLRDETTLARPWAIPGTPGLEHRIGGLEKGDGPGNISYDPANHDFMVRIRQAKVDRIADSLPPLEVDDPAPGGEARRCSSSGGDRPTAPSAPAYAASARPATTSPRPTCATSTRSPNIGDILRRYDKVLVPEMNIGQLSLLLRAKYLVDVVGYNQVRGLPLKAAVLADVIGGLVAEPKASTSRARRPDP